MGQSVASAKPRKGFKEFVRKFFVSLKRSPHNIAMFVMLVTFVFYSLNLTSISNTTALVQGANMGQCEFVTMLLGILALVCILRCFPKREKPNFIMVGLTILMLGVSVFTDCVYAFRINAALTRSDNPIKITDTNKYVTTAQSVVSVHIILLVVCIALIVALPVYSKILRKINTSIDVAGNENMGTIEMAEDE